MFYSKLNSENKTYDLKKISQSCPIIFGMTFLHKKSAVFCTLNLKKIGYQVCIEHSADKLVIAYIFEILNKKLGSVM